MLLRCSFFLPVALGGSLALIMTNNGVRAHPSNLPPPHDIDVDLLRDFGAHIDCPHASEWLTKGPDRAWSDYLNRRRRELQETGSGNETGAGGGMWGGQSQGAEGATATCQLAPGAIGAAHQAVYSGYRSDCPDTPGEGSPYMWPLRWSADIDVRNVPFGSDEVVYHSRSKVYYRLDKNWKRMDNLYSRGVQRSVGQGPCPEGQEGEDPFSCVRNSDERGTMLHRGPKMMFIRWANGTAFDDDDVANIESCTAIDLRVIGNIRPDWFMDDMGDSTDVQYLGDQHVYYMRNKGIYDPAATEDDEMEFGGPILVKQWRKKDFANQYFTMSVLANPGEDGIHWPMILNVPGEGFGDDKLRSFSNHQLLNEDDEDRFFLDEAYVAAGGECIQRGGGAGADGPPVGQQEHIPSNLEVDPNAWFSNVYTFSPVWVPPESSESVIDLTDDSSSMAITKVGNKEKAIVESCYDVATGMVGLKVHFNDLEPAADGRMPWFALAFRKTEECLMTPRGGGDGEMVLVSDFEGTPSPFYGPLPASAKKFEGDVAAAIYAGMTPVDEVEGFADGDVTLADGGTRATLSFRRKIGEGGVAAPDVMNLTYAIGMTPELGYHTERTCFQVTEFPQCPSHGVGQHTKEAGNDVAATLGSGAFVRGTAATRIVDAIAFVGVGLLLVAV